MIGALVSVICWMTSNGQDSGNWKKPSIRWGLMQRAIYNKIVAPFTIRGLFYFAKFMTEMPFMFSPRPNINLLTFFSVLSYTLSVAVFWLSTIFFFSTGDRRQCSRWLFHSQWQRWTICKTESATRPTKKNYLQRNITLWYIIINSKEHKMTFFFP